MSALLIAVTTGASPAAGHPRTDGVTIASKRLSASALGRTSEVRFRLSTTHDRALSPNAENVSFGGPDRDRLLLFLPATGARPLEYTRFLATAARTGFDVLGLDYWNRGHSVIHTCRRNPRCFGEVQLNRLTGEDQNPYSHVERRDSILFRLTSALHRLRRMEPGVGWAQFDHGSRIRWNRIVVAGQSQGGGEAAFIAHRFRVAGVLMFSSPVDSDHGVAASWMTRPGKTPASRMYGLDDAGDIFHSQILASWRKLGLASLSPGPVQGTLPTGSHDLVTTLDLGSPKQSHMRSVDNQTPLGQKGHPVLAGVWTWMLRHVAATSSLHHTQASRDRA